MRAPQLRFIARGTDGTFTKYGLDVQEDQLKAIQKPGEIFSENFGKEPEEIWGFVETIDEAGEITKSRYGIFCKCNVKTLSII